MGFESFIVNSVQKNFTFPPQRRRTETSCFGFCFSLGPKTLILDEPTIGQDHEQKEILRQFIFQMQTQGKTLLSSLHDVRRFVAESNPGCFDERRQNRCRRHRKRHTNQPHNLAESSIVLPQIAQLFIKLKPWGFPKNIIDIYEAKK